MDLQKLKLAKFCNIKVINFPEEVNIGINSIDSNIEVIIYYINSLSDVKNFVDFCNNTKLPTENRTIMVFRKGRKDGVNRDSIFMPFKEKLYSGFKLKAPMLCSLSNELSACVMCKA